MKRPFKFFTLLNDHPDFDLLIFECWNSLNFAGSKTLMVSKKLKHLKSIIRDFSHQNFFGIVQRIAESFNHLLDCQRELLASPSMVFSIRERAAHDTWFKLAKAEESYLFQQSRVKWIDVCDSNSTYYHRSLWSRQAINQIIFLTQDNGDIIDTPEGIKESCSTILSEFSRGNCYSLISFQRRHCCASSLQVLARSDPAIGSSLLT